MTSTLISPLVFIIQKLILPLNYKKIFSTDNGNKQVRDKSINHYEDHKHNFTKMAYGLLRAAVVLLWSTRRLMI